MERWIPVMVLLAALVMTGTAVAALVVVLRDRQEQPEWSTPGLWNVELWSIRDGFRVNLAFHSNAVLGRWDIYENASGPLPAEMDNSISRKHCLLYEQDGALWAWNLSEVNPAMINGYRLNTPRPLLPGDRMELGNSAFLVTRVEYSA